MNTWIGNANEQYPDPDVELFSSLVMDEKKKCAVSSFQEGVDGLMDGENKRWDAWLDDGWMDGEKAN